MTVTPTTYPSLCAQWVLPTQDYLPSTSLGTSALIKMVVALFVVGYYKEFTTLISVTRTTLKEALVSILTLRNTSAFRQ